MLKSSIIVNGARIGKAVMDWAAAGFKVVSHDVHMKRSEECAICPQWDARRGKCMECNCYGAKHWMASESCPIGKW
jgi:hypothetical protein